MCIAPGIFILRYPRDTTFGDTIPVIAFIVLLFAFIILLVISGPGPLYVTYRERQFVREKGTLPPGVIREVSDTGIYMNGQPGPRDRSHGPSPAPCRVRGNGL
jgi:hypothetical protein